MQFWPIGMGQTVRQIVALPAAPYHTGEHNDIAECAAWRPPNTGKLLSGQTLLLVGG